jgi:hypothetical protein
MRYSVEYGDVSSSRYARPRGQPLGCMRAVVGSLLLVCAGLHVVQAGPLEDLRAAEAEYARRVGEQGQSAAWREFLADEAVLLRPTAILHGQSSPWWPDRRVTGLGAARDRLRTDLAFSAVRDPRRSAHVAAADGPVAVAVIAADEWRIARPTADGARRSRRCRRRRLLPPATIRRRLNRAPNATPTRRSRRRATVRLRASPHRVRIAARRRCRRTRGGGDAERERTKSRAVMHACTRPTAGICAHHCEFATS